jgi:predicted small lipoprotein YifL
MKSVSATLGTLFLVLLIAGCGQSGPLYVPGDPSSIQSPPEEPKASEAEDEDDEDDDKQ